MKIVVLDGYTENPGDLSWGELEKLGDVTVYERTSLTDEEEAIRRVVRMVKEQKVTAVTGRDIPIKADSVCVHGDGVKALAFVERIRESLVREEIEIGPLRR